MSLVTQLVGMFGATPVAVGIVLFFGKRYLDKYIDASEARHNVIMTEMSDDKKWTREVLVGTLNDAAKALASVAPFLTKRAGDAA